jgi:hypothetical protein
MNKRSRVWELLKVEMVLHKRNEWQQGRKLEASSSVQWITYPAASTIRSNTRCQNSLTKPMSRIAMLRTSVHTANTRTLKTVTD